MMARSSYIYVVIGSDSTPVAAFTVKHELVAWLRHRKAGLDDLVDLEAWRLEDNVYVDSALELRVSELLAGTA